MCGCRFALRGRSAGAAAHTPPSCMCLCVSTCSSSLWCRQQQHQYTRAQQSHTPASVRVPQASVSRKPAATVPHTRRAHTQAAQCKNANKPLSRRPCSRTTVRFQLCKICRQPKAHCPSANHPVKTLPCPIHATSPKTPPPPAAPENPVQAQQHTSLPASQQHTLAQHSCRTYC